MSTCVLTTCGTSLLNNGADDATRKAITRYANAQEVEIPSEFQTLFNELRQQRERELATASIEQAVRKSAELNGLLALYQKAPTEAQRNQDAHYLIASDTYLGRLTRELVMLWLRRNGFKQVSALDVGGLRTDNLETFRLASNDLIDSVHTLVRACRASQQRVVFNLSGGFKSANGFIQTLGALWADEVVFIFETSGELMRLPKLPVTIDLTSALEAHMPKFRRLSGLNQLDASEVVGVPDGLLIQLGASVSLSPWGRAAFVEARGPRYRAGLLKPWHPKVRFGPGFEKSVAGQSEDRLEHINERIDDLCVFAENGHNPSRMRFKELEGVPVPGSTHQIYAWSDAAADRIFLHREGYGLVLDKLGDHT